MILQLYFLYENYLLIIIHSEKKRTHVKFFGLSFSQFLFCFKWCNSLIHYLITNFRIIWKMFPVIQKIQYQFSFMQIFFCARLQKWYKNISKNTEWKFPPEKKSVQVSIWKIDILPSADKALRTESYPGKSGRHNSRREPSCLFHRVRYMNPIKKRYRKQWNSKKTLYI